MSRLEGFRYFDLRHLLGSIRFLVDQLPEVIYNTPSTPKKIRDKVFEVLRHPSIDTIFFVGPYISPYFVNILKTTNLKAMMAVIDANPTTHTENAVEDFLIWGHEKHIDMNLVQRPPKSKLIHMKILVPMYHTPETGLYAPCALTGSVNFTAGGIIRNDEVLVVLRDRASIISCLDVMYQRALESTTLPDKASLSGINQKTSFTRGAR